MKRVAALFRVPLYSGRRSPSSLWLYGAIGGSTVLCAFWHINKHHSHAYAAAEPKEVASPSSSSSSSSSPSSSSSRWPQFNFRAPHPANVANEQAARLGTQSSKEAEKGVMDDTASQHAGAHVAQRGIGSTILSLSNEAAAYQVAEHDLLSLPVEQAILTKAPQVPPPLNRDHPVLLKVDLTTTSKIMNLTNRLKYEFWTFNDLVPGPMIRARVGDVVELSLKNLDESGNPHNIDCHGFEGPGGGAPITTAQQGETKRARFKLLYPGLYVYHCAAAPVPAHVMNGMYGLMLIEPEYSTLPRVDREYYVMQSEFYHEPLDNTGGNSIVEPSYPKGLDEKADVVVFNGKESALTTDSPLQAKTGDRVRIYFGNAGPNLTSNFHVIGGIFEKVWRDSDMVSAPGRFIQTISVPPGGSSIVDMHMLVPGTYTLVDHAIFRLDKGAVGYLNVTGKPRPDLYTGGDPQPCPGCKLHP